MRTNDKLSTLDEANGVSNILNDDDQQMYVVRLQSLYLFIDSVSVSNLERTMPTCVLESFLMIEI